MPATRANKAELTELVQNALLLSEAFQNELSHDLETCAQELRLFLYSLHLLAALNPTFDLEEQIHSLRHETEQSHIQSARSMRAARILQRMKQLHLFLQKSLVDFERSTEFPSLDRERMRAPTTILQQLLSQKGLTQKVV